MLTTRLVIIGILNDLKACQCANTNRNQLKKPNPNPQPAIHSYGTSVYGEGVGNWAPNPKYGTVTPTRSPLAAGERRMGVRPVYETGLILFMSPICAISRNNHAHKWPVKCRRPLDLELVLELKLWPVAFHISFQVLFAKHVRVGRK